MYSLIENFCAGTRRLELFGHTHSLRPGWVTVGDFTSNPASGAHLWERERWEAAVRQHGSGRCIVPSTPEIEILRPKSPTRNAATSTVRSQNQATPQSQNFGTVGPWAGTPAIMQQAAFAVGAAGMPALMRGSYVEGVAVNPGNIAFNGQGTGWLGMNMPPTLMPAIGMASHMHDVGISGMNQWDWVMNYGGGGQWHYQQ